MEILNILKIMAAVATIATGLLALVKPSAAYGFTGLSAEGPRGVSEIRAIFGGLFICLGTLPLLPGIMTYSALGYVYLAIALARFFSILIDRSYARSNLISLAIEILLGAILVL